MWNRSEVNRKVGLSNPARLSSFGILTARGWCCAQFCCMHFTRADSSTDIAGKFDSLEADCYRPGCASRCGAEKWLLWPLWLPLLPGEFDCWRLGNHDCSLLTGGASRSCVLRVRSKFVSLPSDLSWITDQGVLHARESLGCTKRKGVVKARFVSDSCWEALLVQTCT